MHGHVNVKLDRASTIHYIIKYTLHYILSNQLLPDKLTVPNVLKKFHAFYRTPVFTKSSTFPYPEPG